MAIIKNFSNSFINFEIYIEKTITRCFSSLFCNKLLYNMRKSTRKNQKQ